jgi:hypothetical protein
LVGPEGWKGTGDLVQDNIKMNFEDMEGVVAQTRLIRLRIEKVGLL